MLFVRRDSAKITHADRHCHDARVYVYYVDSRMYFYSLQYLLRLAKTADREKVYEESIVILLSDITDAGGTQILDGMLKGQRDLTRPSKLIWPVQGRPCEQDWKLWRYHISRIYSRPRSQLLHRPLGRWIASSHQTWSWWYDTFNKAAYHKQGNIHVRYVPSQQTRSTTRSRAQWCDRHN